MSANTTLGIPFPTLSDAVDIPGDLSSLATAVDTLITATANLVVGYAEITSNSTTTTSTTESGALLTMTTAALVPGETYEIELFCNIACDNATAVPIGARIRQDTSAGAQVAFGQTYFGSTASTGFTLIVKGRYVASASATKTFVATLQRNGGSTGAYNFV